MSQARWRCALGDTGSSACATGRRKMVAGDMVWDDTLDFDVPPANADDLDWDPTDVAEEDPAAQ